MEQNDKLKLAARKIRESRFTLAFTGAGISVESGIPPFRGADGLWNRYDPKVLEISYFYDHGAECWNYIREIFYTHFADARPNRAHDALAQLEHAGLLQAVVTQNIDNLHQLAGSRNVVEFHGCSARLVCPECHTCYPAGDFDLSAIPPLCTHEGQILKPDFVFFGEGIPDKAWNQAFEYADNAEVCLIIGSGGEVYPASLVPQKAAERGAFVIEINTEESGFTNLSDLHIRGKAGEILPLLLKAIG